MRIKRLLERDPTWAKNFNPRKIKPLINFTMPEAIERVEKVKRENEEERNRLLNEKAKQPELELSYSPTRRGYEAEKRLRQSMKSGAGLMSEADTLHTDQTKMTFKDRVKVYWQDQRENQRDSDEGI